MAIVINGSGTITGVSAGGLPDGSVDSDTLATGIDATKLADGTVTSTELQYINSLSSNAQTQISAANEYSVQNYLSRNMTTASGDQDITGMGFQPSVVFVMAGSGGDDHLGSVGWSDFTKQACLFSESTNTSGERNLNNTCTVWMMESSSGIYQQGAVSALADGVRITWTKLGSPASLAFWICVMGIK